MGVSPHAEAYQKDGETITGFFFCRFFFFILRGSQGTQGAGEVKRRGEEIREMEGLR